MPKDHKQVASEAIARHLRLSLRPDQEAPAPLRQLVLRLGIERPETDRKAQKPS